MESSEWSDKILLDESQTNPLPTPTWLKKKRKKKKSYSLKFTSSL